MVQIFVSHLRKLLPEGVLRTRASGYSMELEAEELDVARFEALAAEGREALAAGEPGLAAARLRAALSLWAAPRSASSTSPSRPPRALGPRRSAWRRSRTGSTRSSKSGRQADPIAELEALVQRHPERERLRGQHMLALYRSGRQADAPRLLPQARRVLSEELGLEPSRALRRLEERILRQDPSLAAPARSAPAMSVPPPLARRQPAGTEAERPARRGRSAFAPRFDAQRTIGSSIRDGCALSW